MKIFRSIFSVMLVLVATVLVSCGSPEAAAPPTYTPEKLQTIKTYRIPIDVARDNMSKLGELIGEQDWVDTRSYIHGPLGFLRRDFRYLSNTLLPDDAEQAKEIAEDIFLRLENLDAAAKEKDAKIVATEYGKAIADFDSYLDLIPDRAS
ncbi:photosystem II protein PsbQ [Hyella patelloides]|nr:photosystem II protein PsbQ [Hyella patelloides]